MPRIVRRVLLTMFALLVTLAFCNAASAEERGRGRDRGGKAQPTPTPEQQSQGKKNNDKKGEKKGGGGILGIIRGVGEVGEALSGHNGDRDRGRASDRRRDNDRRIDRRDHDPHDYGRRPRHRRYRHDISVYVSTRYYHERYCDLGMERALFPMYYDVEYFGGVKDGNTPIGPHFKTLAINPVLKNFYWPYPYAPEPGTHTYCLPRKQAPATCDNGSPCYAYWDWKRATILLNEARVPTVYAEREPVDDLDLVDDQSEDPQPADEPTPPDEEYVE